MERNQIIGVLLIFGLFYLYLRMNAPSPAELVDQKRIQDSIAMVEARNAINLENNESSQTTTFGDDPFRDQSLIDRQIRELSDSLKKAQMSYVLGPFSDSGFGEEKFYNLENDLLKITFSNKGGIIKEAWLKDYKKVVKIDGEKQKIDLKLLNDEKNKFEFLLPIATSAGIYVKTSDLYFTPTVERRTIKFRAYAGEGRYIELKYTLGEDGYGLDFDFSMVGMHQIFQANTSAIRLNWVDYLDRIELNTNFEKYYSTVYFKVAEEGSDYCSCRGDDEEDLKGQELEWASHANQFFNTTLIARGRNFIDASFSTKMTDDDSEDLKVITTNLSIPFDQTGNETFAMAMYIGPNDFDRLEKFGNELEQVIPFGRSIFGTINRYIIRPLFDFLFGRLGSTGLAIIIMITIVKFILYPLMYKMLLSQAKMAALKPEISGLKEKYKGDAQKAQMETMKIYREYGVSPLGGCMPMIVQMPIWYALFRFFPAYLDFRQESFLWADDLSSYDVFFNLPWEIPMYGSHVSLFTILWAITTIIYTYYNRCPMCIIRRRKHFQMTYMKII